MKQKSNKRVIALCESLRKILCEDSNDDRQEVGATAYMAHHGQTRRDGSEYIVHPREVSRIIERLYPGDELAILVALLHDTFEDAPGLGTVQDKEELRSFIRGSIGDGFEAEEVIEAVERLTHEKGADYAEYVQGLLDNKLALRVKLADMLHNLSDNPKPKQAIKYKGALDALYDAAGEQKPPGISPLHWKLLMNTVAKLGASKDSVSIMVAERKKIAIINKAQLKKFITESVRKTLREQGIPDRGRCSSYYIL